MAVGLPTRAVNNAIISRSPVLDSYLNGQMTDAEQGGNLIGMAATGVFGARSAVVSAGKSAINGAKITSEVVSFPKGGTYQLVDDLGTVVRNGRTKDHDMRRTQHSRSEQTAQYTYVERSRTDDYATQRGLEQMQLDVERGVLDKIRGIAISNPNRSTYMDAGARYLGMQKW